MIRHEVNRARERVDPSPVDSERLVDGWTDGRLLSTVQKQCTVSQTRPSPGTPARPAVFVTVRDGDRARARCAKPKDTLIARSGPTGGVRARGDCSARGRGFLYPLHAERDPRRSRSIVSRLCWDARIPRGVTSKTFTKVL
jgi:hypothetical protein